MEAMPQCLTTPAARRAWLLSTSQLETVHRADQAGDGRYGQHLVRACLDAAYVSNLHVRSHVGVEVDHATEALRAHDVSPEVRRCVHARLTALVSLADRLEREGDELLERLKGLDGALGIPRRPTWAPTPAPQATP